jgi:hypothetical protein
MSCLHTRTMIRQHQRIGAVGENQHLQKEIGRCTMRKVVSESHRTIYSTGNSKPETLLVMKTLTNSVALARKQTILTERATAACRRS